MEKLGERLAPIALDAAIRTWWMAYSVQPSPENAVKISQKMFKAGNVSSAASLLALGGDPPKTSLFGELRLCARLLHRPVPIPKPSFRESTSNEIAYIASSSLSQQTRGYTVRTHELLTALLALGVPVRCYTRPGYPWDRQRVVANPNLSGDVSRVGGIEYFHTRIDDVAVDPEHFIERMSEALEARLRERPPLLVHAASNQPQCSAGFDRCAPYRSTIHL